ncbi:hypothetical protein ABZ801_38665 [Actinomadura sp. NPDC047616]|uniref:hypothetical protein n=1 Tax=Actinomadura sp. NPDC047616 TaxID=3155914 RepID=UPI0033DC66F5
MRTTRRPGTARRPVVGRVLGYGGSVVLVVAAVVVLLMPLFDDGRRAASSEAADRTTPEATPSGGQVPPVGTVPTVQPTVTPTGTVPRQDGGGRSSPQQQSGPRPEQQSGTTVTWCPAGSAVYRAGDGGLEVTVNASASGFARAQVSLRSGHTAEEQATVRDGVPHTFRFTGVPAAEVERVKVTTISVGVSTQTCYARPAA